MRYGGKDMYSTHRNYEANAVQRVSHLPLVRSALQSVSSTYTDIKGRYPVLGLMGGMAEVCVRTMSMVAMHRASPLMQSLEPQIELANGYACVGLDQLEKNFPVLHQSTDEVIGHLKDAFFLTVDDVQMSVIDGLDGALDYWERVSDVAWTVVQSLQESQVGRVATSGLDDVLSRLEDATAYYLPLPPTIRREWEMMILEYKDEDEDNEPGMWTRFRGILLSLGLQLYHRLLRQRDQLEQAVQTLGKAANAVGLVKLLEVVGLLLQQLQLLLVALVYRVESLNELALAQVWSQAKLLAELGPIKQVVELPAHVQVLVRDLQELSKILVQLLVNTTPLYNMLQQPSEQEVEAFLSKEVVMSDSHGSASSLFFKTMDGYPRRRRSLYSLFGIGANNHQVPGPAKAGQAGSRRGSLKQAETEGPAKAGQASSRRGSLKQAETEGPALPSDGTAQQLQSVSQLQKAFEYLSPRKHSVSEPSSSAVEKAVN